MYTDPIADYLTRIRNASSAGHRVVEIPSSNLKKEITKVLFDQGYILSYKFEENDVQGTIKIALKYDKETKEPVMNGLGNTIVSTSKGVMTGKQARALNIGGEVICNVY